MQFRRKGIGSKGAIFLLRLVRPDMMYFDSYVYFCEQYKLKKVIHYFVEEKEQLLTLQSRLLDQYRDEEMGVHLKPGHVPSSRYWLIENEEVVGVGSIRHGLTDGLERIGGHIGYGIRPDKFNLGYGTVQLRLLLEEAAGLGLRKVLLTCDVKNIGSRRVMEKNGGVWIDVVDNSFEDRELFTNRILLDTGCPDDFQKPVSDYFFEQHLMDGKVGIRFKKKVEDSTCVSYYYMVLNHADDEVGLVILRIGSEDSLYVDGNIGYYVYEKHRGHRYTTKACELVLKLLKQSGLRYLFITCDLDNQVSIAVCESLGAKYQELILYYEAGQKKLKRRYKFTI